MISSAPIRTNPRVQLPAHARLEWSEVSVRCRADIANAVNAVMGAMGEQPYSVTDGFAVQQATAETLESIFKLAGKKRSTPIWLKYTVSPERVQIEIRAPHTEKQPVPDANALAPGLNRVQTKGSLAKSFMTSVEYRDEGRHVFLTRRRGQGPAVNGPPVGYDFQI